MGLANFPDSECSDHASQLLSSDPVGYRPHSPFISSSIFNCGTSIPQALLMSMKETKPHLSFPLIYGDREIYKTKLSEGDSMEGNFCLEDSEVLS